jgi:exopolyphosphatase/guanosine-5'-triphosphate,3'-diphosphate pyrophosphatase
MYLRSVLPSCPVENVRVGVNDRGIRPRRHHPRRVVSPTTVRSDDDPAMTAAPAPPEIVPRWEWRTFGSHLEPAESRLAGLPVERTQDSSEYYLLSVHDDASVKLRDERVDVKRLERVDEHGLELWKPVMKAGFPLPRADVELLMAALGITVTDLERATYSGPQLRSELAPRHAELLLVSLTKHRQHFTIDGCMVEYSTFNTEIGSTQTIAIESPDPELVLETVRKLGLEHRPNVNVARGLKTLAGFDTQRYAVIDVGTNSVKFHVGARSADCSWTTIVDRSEVTRLGEGLDDSGRLQPAPIERTATAIAEMVDEARRNAVVEIAAVGTAGVRIASNRDELIDAVRIRRGITIEVLSGEEEGRLAYLAATAELPVGDGRLVVFDSGGGSSQFSFGVGTHVDERFSVNVGAVRFAERFHLDGAVDKDVIDEALEAIAADLDRLNGRPVPAVMVALGGTSTNMAAVKHGLSTYDPDVVHGTVLDLVEIDRQIELYRTRTADERRAIAGLQPKRAEVILAGACIVRTILSKLGMDAATVSDRGLRHGLLVDRFGA